tara:strand:+ start:18703 stop:18954 length:252 start_codon:yes stop_codon:yes gene_type:complete
MARNNREFTPSQEKILEMLSDGKPHTKYQLKLTYGDEFTSCASLKNLIKKIRKQLRPKGQDILCEYANRTIHYRWVRLINAAE